MSEPRHTPGPWTVGHYTPSADFLAIPHHSCVCDPRTNALIATCGPAHDRQSQVDADLIAAAPDLLAACEALVTCLVEMGFSGPRLSAARAALAKARGGVNKS